MTPERDFTDERIAEARARCEGDRDLYHAAYTDLPDALDALAEARRERDELKAEVDRLQKVNGEHFDCYQDAVTVRERYRKERDEAEALLLWCYRKCGFNFVADEECEIEALLRKRGLLENGQ